MSQLGLGIRFLSAIVRQKILSLHESLSSRSNSRRLICFIETWGQPVKRERDFERISAFYRLNPPKEGEFSLDGRTWRDLEFDSVYSNMERCQSRPGRQFLYRMLRVTKSDNTGFENLFARYRIFTQEKTLREEVQLILTRLDSVAADGVAGLLWADLPPGPRFAFLFYLASAATMVSLALIFLHPLVLMAALALGICNIIINGTYFQRLNIHSGSLAALNAMLAAAQQLGDLSESYGLTQLEYLRRHAGTIRAMRKKIGWLVRDKTAADTLLNMAVEFLNIFLLFDLLAFIRTLKHLKVCRKELRGVFEAVGSLDAEISVASWLAGHISCCAPVFNNNRQLILENCVHPLIENPVSNSVELSGESILITGSNMAGKTTFIKTVGINVVLARTLGVCLADRAGVPMLQVMSSIERESVVEDRRSRHLAEIDRLGEFIRLCEQGWNYLFLVDEIFHGTNTMERISSAAAVLRFLGARAMLLVTTHDLELAGELDGMFRMCHFSEMVEEDRFFFDYRLKPGPCNTRNAIRLLELEGYPQAIVLEARNIAGKFGMTSGRGK
jgi:hypothetical protein